MADIVLEVPCITRWSPNHGDARSKTLGGVLHSTHGPTLQRAGESLEAWYEREYQANIVFMLKTKEQGNTNQVSPTFLVGPREVCRLIPDHLDPWSQRYPDNDTHWGIEIAMPAAAAKARRGFTDFQYRATAEICYKLSAKYGTPTIHVTEEWKPGLIAHKETTSGEASGKWDPDPSFDWTVLLHEIEALRVADQGAFAGIDPDLVAYYHLHPELGEPRHGPGLYFTSAVGDIFSLSTKGGIAVKRHYDPDKDDVHQIKHFIW